MGDMGDIFNDLKDIRREQRAGRAAEANAAIDDVRAKVDSLAVDPNGTWNVIKGSHKIQYYPTKGTWQERGKMRRGGVEAFSKWLDKVV